jgi:uncharacterized protein YqjF (DUF2071 family)
VTAPLPTDAERLAARARPAGAAVMRQRWCRLGFFHWPVDPAALARLLPPGLDVDTFDGVAYVGLVPFTIPQSRTPRLGVPICPPFHEANLRTYVHRGGRDPGVWFFSLEAQSRLAVAGARIAYRLPYFHARMSMEVAGDPGAPSITYASARRTHGPAELRCRYRPTGPPAPAQPGTLELFLIERYRLYAWTGRTLREARVHHAPYAVQPAAVDALSESLTRAAGLPPIAGPPPLVHYAEEADVEVFPPRRVESASPP